MIKTVRRVQERGVSWMVIYFKLVAFIQISTDPFVLQRLFFTIPR